MATLVQSQELRLEVRLLPIRLSAMLEMREADYRRWVILLESDPLFRLLAQPPAGLPRVLRRRPWPKTRWSLPGLESAVPAQEVVAAETPDVPPGVLAAVLAMGREAFERYFLHNEGEHTLEAAAAACRLPMDLARAVAGLVDAAALSAGPLPATPAGAAGAGPEVVAVFEAGRDGIALAFPSTHYARGRYAIDYDGLEAFKAAGVIAREDWGRVRELLGRLETVNAKQTVLMGLLGLARREQQAYLHSGDPARLTPLPQKEAATRLSAAPSSVSRALAGRAARLPWGEVRPLAALFPSRRTVAIEFVRAALTRRPALADRELRSLLRAQRGIRVTRRSVNDYRRTAAGGRSHG